MPVRIYDIAKNLGIQSKDVLVKAKELNITNAKVASSSLDKITAEYLEEQLAKELKPEEAAPEVEETPVEAAEPTGPVLIVAPEEEPAEEVDPEKAAAIYSDLHANIQDAFNEAGVEILSPHYRAARDGNMVTIPASYLPPDYSPPSFRVESTGKKTKN